MVRIGRDIFFDLAWLHEAFLDHPTEAIKLGHLHDRFNEYTTYATGLPTFAAGFPTRSYGAAWNKITAGRVAEGNRDLLENEQKSIIPPHYELCHIVRGTEEVSGRSPQAKVEGFGVESNVVRTQVKKCR